MGGNGVYRVTFLSPTSGDQLYTVPVPSRERVPIAAVGNIAGCGFMEVVFPYSGEDLQTGGELLEVQGIAENCLDGPRTTHFTNLNGTFLGVFRLLVGRGVPFGTEWEDAALDVRPDPHPRAYEANGLGAPQRGARDFVGPGNTILVTPLRGDVGVLFYSRAGVFVGTEQVASGAAREIDVPDGAPKDPTGWFEILPRGDLAIGTYQRL